MGKECFVRETHAYGVTNGLRTQVAQPVRERAPCCCGARPITPAVVVRCGCAQGGHGDPVSLLDDITPPLAELGASAYASSVDRGAWGNRFYPARGLAIVHIAIGDCAARVRLALEAAALGFEFATGGPSARGGRYRPTATFGAGSFVASGRSRVRRRASGARIVPTTAPASTTRMRVGDGVARGAGLRCSGGHVRVGSGALDRAGRERA
jgi:hypothetical protein